MLKDELNQIMKGIVINSGFPSPFASMISELYFEPEPISMQDLANRIGYSLASISLKLKMFEYLGFISRKKKPGTSKVFLYMEKDLIGKGLYLN